MTASFCSRCSYCGLDIWRIHDEKTVARALIIHAIGTHLEEFLRSRNMGSLEEYLAREMDKEDADAFLE